MEERGQDMTRKDYEKIAEVLRQSVEGSRRRRAKGEEFVLTEGFIITAIVAGLCEVFEADNPRFDVGRFESAVWGEVTK